jgi:hypothetical protein
MDEFSSHVEAWRDFFTLSGTAAATIIGLLFVAVTLRQDIRNAPANSLVRAMVTQNFTNLLVVLLFSLYFMVPDMGRIGMGWSLLLTAAVPLVSIPTAWRRFRHDAEMTNDVAFWTFLVPALCYLATIGIAIAVFVRDDAEMAWFVPVIAFLIAIPTRNAWEVLMDSHESG